jgi:hypothetical protein
MTIAGFFYNFLQEQATQTEAGIVCVSGRHGSLRNHLAVFPLAG